MAHQYLVTKPIDGVHPATADCCATRHTSSTSARRSAGWCMGGYERAPAPWALDGIPTDFNGKLLPPDWERFERSDGGRGPTRAGASADAEVIRLINGPEAFTPDGEFILGDDRGPRLLRRRPASARTGSPAPAASGAQMADVDRRRRAGARRCGRWTSAGSAPQYRSSRLHARADRRDLRAPTTTSTIRTRSASAGRPLRLSPTYPRLAELGAVLRREVGLGAARTGSSRTRAPGTRRCGRAAGPGEHLVAGDRRRAPSRPARRRALFDETSFAKLEVVGPGALGVPPAAVRQRRRPADVGSIVYTQMLNRARRHRVRLHRHAARRTTGSASSPARRSATTTRVVHPAAPARRRIACRCSTSPSARVCIGLWGPRARDILAPRRRPRDVSNAAFPYLHRARDRRRRRPGPRAAGHLRRASSAGSSTRPTEYGLDAVDDALGGGPAARAGRRRLPRDRLAPAREGLPRLERATSRPTRRRTRPGSGSRSSWARATSSAARRWSGQRAAGLRRSSPA